MNGGYFPVNSQKSAGDSGIVKGFAHICVIKQSNMSYPATLKYTKDHEWISLEGDIATIGITDFAQRELGDIVYVEVESIGKELEAGAVFGTVEAVKTVSDLIRDNIRRVSFRGFYPTTDSYPAASSSASTSAVLLTFIFTIQPSP